MIVERVGLVVRRVRINRELRINLIVLLYLLCGSGVSSRVLTQSSAQEAEDATYTEIKNAMCSSDAEERLQPQQISENAQRQFPFNLIGVLTVQDLQNSRVRQCTGLVLTTRAILSSADCFYTRSATNGRGDSVSGQSNDPFNFKLKDQNLTQTNQYEIQSYIVAEQFRDLQQPDFVAFQYNFGIGFLKDELEIDLVSQKYRFSMSDKECQENQVSDVLGYLYSGQELQWGHTCQYKQNGCNSTCEVKDILDVDQENLNYNGAPIMDCIGNEQFTLRGIYDRKSQVAIDQINSQTILNMLTNSNNATLVIPQTETNPYFFSAENAAFTDEVLQTTCPTSVCPECTKCDQNYQVWHIIIAILLTVVFMLVIEFFLYRLLIHYNWRNKKNMDLSFIEDELEDDIDLQININRDVTKKSVLGQGGQGQVFKGVWHPKPRQVAVKTLKQNVIVFEDNSFEQDQQIDEMKQELLYLCKMRHPNILHCYGGSLFPQVAMVMEFCKGGDLYDYVYNIRGGRLETEECYSVGYDIASGLAFLHKNNIIHRDIKPKNILRVNRSTKEVGVVKIADFGIARLVPDEQTQMDTNKNQGTLVYMAPEIQMGEDKKVRVGRKADIYSLAMLLFECATGLQPFQGVPQNVVHYRVCKEPQGERPNIPEDVEPVLAEIIEKCWAHDPKNRPESEELAAVFKLLLCKSDASRSSQLELLKGRMMRYGNMKQSSSKSISPFSQNPAQPDSGSTAKSISPRNAPPNSQEYHLQTSNFMD